MHLQPLARYEAPEPDQDYRLQCGVRLAFSFLVSSHTNFVLCSVLLCRILGPTMQDTGSPTFGYMEG